MLIIIIDNYINPVVLGIVNSIPLFVTIIIIITNMGPITTHDQRKIKPK